ncbi:MlaD family protein [Nocardia sp. NPDC004654]|uniref:MlaD family protein n=1 Tax=Nocardia sp. NPDC004654 TaxID=3154776 RepID=UPI0033A9B755
MNTRALVSLTAILAVLVFGVAYMTFGVLNIDPRRSYIRIDMRLDNSGGLGPNSPVLLNGVHVGRAASVRKAADGVAVELRIDDRFRIPVSSLVRIEQLSVLGEPYIGFEPEDGAGPYLTNGQVVPADQVRTPMTITALSARLVELLDQVHPEVMASLVGTFDRALAGTDAAMQTLQRSTTLLAATLLSRTGHLRQLFGDLQLLGADIDWMGPSLTAAGPLFGEFGVTLNAIVESSAGLIDSRPSDQYFTGDGLLPFLVEVETLVQKIGPDIAPLGPMLQPVVADAVGRAPRLDISALIEQALHGVGDDGALHFRIQPK